MKKKKLGKLPEQNIELLAVPTPADIDAAKVAAKTHAPTRFVNLLEAKRGEETTQQS